MPKEMIAPTPQALLTAESNLKLPEIFLLPELYSLELPVEVSSFLEAYLTCFYLS